MCLQGHEFGLKNNNKTLKLVIGIVEEGLHFRNAQPYILGQYLYLGIKRNPGFRVQFVFQSKVFQTPYVIVSHSLLI